MLKLISGLSCDRKFALAERALNNVASSLERMKLALAARSMRLTALAPLRFAPWYDFTGAVFVAQILSWVSASAAHRLSGC